MQNVLIFSLSSIYCLASSSLSHPSSIRKVHTILQVWWPIPVSYLFCVFSINTLLLRSYISFPMVRTAAPIRTQNVCTKYMRPNARPYIGRLNIWVGIARCKYSVPIHDMYQQQPDKTCACIIDRDKVNTVYVHTYYGSSIYICTNIQTII